MYANGDRLMVKRIILDGLGKPKGPYVHAVDVRAKRLLFVAGTIPTDAKGRIVGEGDMRAQAKQVYENIRRVLKSQGLTPGNIVKSTVYTTNVDEFRKGTERQKFYAGKFTAGTLIEVKRLALNEVMVEVEVIAAAE
ncbi:MAG: RidA family protein [Thaumarchaeota archaeon]|nr:RidA family protein [Nitrososphaerota archaeon]